MDLTNALPVLKWLGIGAGGSVAIIAVYQFWVYTSIMENRKRSCNNETSIREHTTNLAVMDARQIGMDKKLDRLIELHLNGKEK